MKYSSNTESNVQFTLRLENAVRGWLQQAGYSVIKIDSQDWAAHFMFSKRNTDGSVNLYFGPVSGDGDDHRHFRYLLVREQESHGGVINVPAGARAVETANDFMSLIAPKLTNLVPV